MHNRQFQKHNRDISTLGPNGRIASVQTPMFCSCFMILNVHWNTQIRPSDIQLAITFNYTGMHVSTQDANHLASYGYIRGISAFTWVVYVTRSDKTSLIARKYTHAYNGMYLLFCKCY